MAGDNDFSKVLMEALMETFAEQDAGAGHGTERRSCGGKARTLRIDLHGVTIDRLVVEVPRE